MKYLSLFSWIGGFELWLQQAYEQIMDVSSTTREQSMMMDTSWTRSDTEQKQVGMEQPHCIWFSEIDKYATAVYQSHFPNHHAYGDITKIDAESLPDFDMLCGWFPCQAFSIAWKRLWFADTRGTLFFEIARILEAKQPRLLFLENVKGLLSHDEWRTFKTILATLTELGYDLQWQVLNSKNHGVPQNRERVFIVWHLRGTPRPEVFPFWESNGKTIIQLNKPKHSNDRVYGTDGLSPTLNTMQGGNRQPFISKTVRSGGRSSPHGSKQNWDSYEYQWQIRRLTPTECERLQGFPDGWTKIVSDSQRYKCCGNAVTVNVIQDIAIRLLTP